MQASKNPIRIAYRGQEPTYKVAGVMSGKIYRWRGNGYVVEMELRDWQSLSEAEKQSLSPYP